jgi:hypothetical protein
MEKLLFVPNRLFLPFRMWFDQDTEYMNDDSDSEVGDNEDEDSNGKT